MFRFTRNQDKVTKLLTHLLAKWGMSSSKLGLFAPWELTPNLVSYECPIP